jgi:hypothetical protein
MMYNDGIKTPTKFLPEYTHWKLPMTEEQLEAWAHLALPTTDRFSGFDARLAMPLLTSWADQRGGYLKVRRYNARHRALGLCLQCPEPVGPSSRRYCERCHTRRMENQRRYRTL